MNTDYLELTGLTVSFDGFVAVDGVDLSVLKGDLRFLIGPNGAGKTTLIDAVSGLVSATGRAEFAGRDLLGLKVHKIARLGVGRTFQTATVFEELSVLQNLDIAAGASRSPWTLLRKRSGVPEVVEEAMETVEGQVGKLEAELRSWGVRLDKLLAKVDAAGTGAKIDYRRRLDDLKEKYVTAAAKFAELKVAGREKWDTLKGGVETAWRELETAFTRLAN